MAIENLTGHLFGRNNYPSFSVWYSSNQDAIEDSYFDYLCKASRERFEPDTFHDFAHDLFKVQVHGMYGVEL